MIINQKTIKITKKKQNLDITKIALIIVTQTRVVATPVEVK
jgi:hypothetical protein